MYSFKKIEDPEKLVELPSLQNQVEEMRSQDKIGKQNFYENIKKVVEPVTDTIKHTFENITKRMMLTSKGDNTAIENLNDETLEKMNVRVIIASYL